MDILEQIEDFMSPSVPLEIEFDGSLFDRMAEFLMKLEPDQLSDEQLEELIGIMDDLEMQGEEEANEAKMAKKTLASKNTYSKQWYRRNKSKIKRRKEKLKKSAEGKKRERKKDSMRSSNKTPTGRPLRKYHTSKHTN